MIREVQGPKELSPCRKARKENAERCSSSTKKKTQMSEVSQLRVSVPPLGDISVETRRPLKEAWGRHTHRIKKKHTQSEEEERKKRENEGNRKTSRELERRED